MNLPKWCTSEDGYGDGSGSGSGYGYGYCYCDGSGYGYGYGDGSGYGDGDGDGDGSGEVEIPKECAWIAYHYIRKDRDGYLMRNGKHIKVGEIVHEAKIEMCVCGLHAGLSKYEAKQYAPTRSVLTKVKVFGKIILGKDKLVATDKYIIEQID